MKPEYGMMGAATSVHLKNAMLALTFGIFPLGQFFAAPMIGEFADIHGRKKAFYLSLLGLTAGFLLSAWAIALHSIWLLFFSRLLSGIFAGNISICMATLADLSVDEKMRAKNFSMVTALFGVSWVAAMIVGGYIGNPRLMGHFGPVFAFLISTALSFLNLIILIFMFKDTAPRHPDTKFRIGQGLVNIKQVLLLKPTRIFFAIYFAWSLGWVIAVQWYPSFSMEVFNASVYEFTSWFLIMGITWTLGAFFAKYFLINKCSTLTVATIGFGAMTLCLLIMQFIPSFTIFSILFGIAAFFAVFAMSSSLNLISTAAPADVQGKIMGLSQSAQSIAFVLVSTIAFLVSIYTISILFYFSAAISALGFALLLYKQARRDTV
ncbi:MAG: hypothetical protein SP1CHLAM9_03880 [Chlamydiia bacterium]|nr:hypothetical protein [Chlamydiia bacterium]